MPTADRGASLEQLLRGVPYLADLDRVSVARLLGALDEVSYRAGALIAEEGATPDALYLLEEGAVRVTVRSDAGEVEVADVSAPGYLGDLGLLLSRRTGSIRAATDVRVWRLPRERFEALVRERPEIALSLTKTMAELLDRRQRSLVGAPIVETERPQPRTPVRRDTRRRTAASVTVSLFVPLALWWLPPPAGLNPGGWHVLAILGGAAVAWLLEPAPDFVIALAMAAAWGITGAAPLAAVMSGFASSSWLLALGALALATAMIRSGLLFRALELPGTAQLDDLEDRLDVHFDVPDGEVSTIGGYLMAKLGRIPERGDSWRVGEYEVFVEQTEGPRVMRVRIEPKIQPAAATTPSARA